MSIEGLLIGRVLGGRYRIEELIGRGGMGAVYRALDERLGRLVALKVVTVAGPGDPESRERLRARFFREARSAAALPHHPNVVPVYDYGTDEELGLDYIVMELLRGSDLASRLARVGPPPLAAGLKILLEAARGIAVGHRQGLIHRDIKPGNIFLTEPRPGEVQVRVLDFGIAKLTDDDDTFGQLTQDGRVPHSPAFASPEQLRGLSQITPASDVFALGAVGYQLLTGQRPFTDADRNRIQLGMAVEPKPLREHNSAIPGSIDTLIRKCLELDPQRRFADADELVTELERAVRALADQPVEPYLAGAAIVTATEEDTLQPVPPAPPISASPAVAPVSPAPVPMGEEDDDRTQVFDDDDRTLLAPPPVSPSPPPVRKPLDTRPPAAAAATTAPKTPHRRPEPVARVAAQPKAKRSRGGFFVWTFVLLTLLVAGMWLLNEFIGSSSGPSLADQLRPADPQAEPVVVDSIPPAIRVPSSEEMARDFDQRGRRFHAAGAFDSAAFYFAQAVALHPTVPEYHRNFGLTLLELGDPSEAEAEFRRAIAINPDLPQPYLNLSRAQLALGDTMGAISSLERYAARETGMVQKAAAESQINVLRAAQNPQAPPLLGEEIETPSGGGVAGPDGSGGVETPTPPSTPSQSPSPTPPGLLGN